MALIPGGRRRRRRPAVSPPPPSGRALLQPSDITYVKAYTENIDPYGGAMAIWYVSDEPRVLTTFFHSGTQQKYLIELQFPTSGSYMHSTRYFAAPWIPGSPGIGGANSNKLGFNWDEQDGKLWVGTHTDYYATLSTASFLALTPNKVSGAIAWQGYYGFQNIRGEFGKLVNLRVPSWFQTLHSVPARCTLGGGYGSRLAQDLPASQGPLFVFHPNMNQYTGMGYDNTGQYNIPATDYKIAADHRSGTRIEDWYSSCPGHTTYSFANRPFDRGVRVSQYHNYHDNVSGPCYNDDTRQYSNPSTPPTADPNPNGHWLRAGAVANDPDGWGRWVWDDYTDCAFWLDNDAGTELKHGIGIVGTFGTGKNYYMSSTGHDDGCAIELHWYDPATLASVMSGALAPYKCRPTWILDLSPFLTAWQKTGWTTQKRLSVAGCYDSQRRKMFVMLRDSYYGGSIRPSIHEFDIAG